MKELSIEEKAKAYDEALKVANKYKDTHIMFPSIKDEMFPELKESEDERIRKSLITCISTLKHPLFSERERNEFIAWLEKQGEKDKLIKELGEYKVKYIQEVLSKQLEKQGEHSIYNVPSREVVLAIWYLGNEWKELTNGSISTEHGTQLDYIQKHWRESEYYLREKQGEQKPAELPKGEDYGIDGLWHAISILKRTLGEVEGYQSDDGILEHKCAISAVNELYERKPVWSEEDAEMINYVASILYSNFNENEKFDNNKPCVGALVDWLKSLKDRVQPKQEWNEEDEKYINGLIRGLAAKRDIHKQVTFSSDNLNITNTINWLDSLKDRVRFQWECYDDEDLDTIADKFIPEPVWNALEESKGEGSNAAAYDYSQMIAMFKAGIQWLKSLRPQNTWKPSDEQLEALEHSLGDYNITIFEERHETLTSLYQDLKKLRGE